MNFRNLLLCGVVSVASTIASGQALAQATGGGAAASNDATTIGEVVVTARRRQEALQNVPTSIAAFSQKTLTEQAIATAFDLNKAVPGLTVEADSGNPSLASFSIRGRGQNYGAAAGSVETYFAEIPLSSPFQIPQLPAQFFDLQSLQVVKGPQGTLFGRSTTGGAVLIVPQAPTDQYGGYLRLQGGSYGDFQAEGAVNIPIVEDKAMLRIAGFDWQRDGYMTSLPIDPLTHAQITDPVTGRPLPKQTYDNVNTTEVRATLLLRPFEGLENSTLLTYHYDMARTSSGSGVNIIGAGTPTGGFGAAGRPTFFTPGYGTYTSYLDTNLTKPANRDWAIANTTTYALTKDLTLKNIFGYINTSGYTDDAADSDGYDVGAVSINLLVPPRPRENQQYTDELQLQGKSLDDRLTWVVGGLVDKTREPGALNQLNIASAVNNFGLTNTTFEQNTVDSYAGFGSATYKASDQVEVSVGYRHSWDHVAFAQEQQAGTNGTVYYGAGVFNPTIGAGPNSPCPTVGVRPAECIVAPLSHESVDLQGDTYNLDISYHITRNDMVYGGYRRGYKHGGFNESQTDPALSSFQPETVDDFYLGLKSRFDVAGVPVRFNIEGYNDRYHNMQVSYLSSNGQQLTTITTNVPETTFRGFDTDILVDATKWLTVSVNYALIDAFYEKWPDTTSLVPGLTQDLTGNPVDYTSPNKVSATFRFHTELEDNRGELVFAPTVSNQSAFYTSPVAKLLPLGEAQVLGGPFSMAAGKGAMVPAYTLVDLRAEWNHIWGSRIDGAVNVTNLTDQVYLLGNGATLNFGIQGEAYGPPRMVTVELSTKF